LEVLEEGIFVGSEETQDIYHSHGCEVEKKSNIVKIPNYIVEEAISVTPKRGLYAG